MVVFATKSLAPAWCRANAKRKQRVLWSFGLSSIVTLSNKGNIMASELQLEPASPETKRYSRQKIAIALTGTILGLVVLAIMAFGVGPVLGRYSSEWFDGNDWLRLFVSAAALGLVMEVISLPLSFYSGYVLEHRYHLSNQTLTAGCGNGSRAMPSAACSA